MPVSSLQFTNLGPFDEVSFEFDPQVNVFVGPNNCGKTTVLVALADIFVDWFNLPAKLLRGDATFSETVAGMPDGFETVRGELPFLGRASVPRLRLGEFRTMLCQALGYRTFVPALRLSTEFRAKAAGSLSVSASRGPICVS